MSNPIVSFDEQAVKDELRELVEETIEEAINAKLDEEAAFSSAPGPTSAPTRGRRTERDTTSEASPPRRARSHSRCPSSQVQHHFLLGQQIVSPRHLGQSG